jgi:choline transport protein
MEKVSNVETETVPDLLARDKTGPVLEGEINASGHRQELQRNFNLLALCGVALTVGNSWVAFGGSIVRPVSSMHAEWELLTRRRWWGCTTADHQA